MPKNKNLFARSFQELRSLRCLAITALFIAMNITLDLLKLRIDLPGMRIGVGFLTNASIGMLYGPAVCMMMGFCTDVLGFLMNPGTGGGGYFPGYTLTAIVAGAIWGVFLYRPDARPSDGSLRARLRFPLRTFAARLLITVVCNVGMNTLWLSITGDGALWLPLALTRLPAQMLYFPMQYLLLLVVLPLVQRLYWTAVPSSRPVAER